MIRQELPVSHTSSQRKERSGKNSVLNLTPILALVVLIMNETLIQAKHSSGFRKLIFLLRMGAVFVVGASRLHAD